MSRTPYDSEAEGILDALYARMTCAATTKQVRYIMLKTTGQIFSRGEFCDIKRENLGGGVSRLRAVPRA